METAKSRGYPGSAGSRNCRHRRDLVFSGDPDDAFYRSDAGAGKKGESADDQTAAGHFFKNTAGKTKPVYRRSESRYQTTGRTAAGIGIRNANNRFPVARLYLSDDLLQDADPEFPL